MKIIDMRFDSELLKSFIGKKFVKYKSDAFEFTNSVTQIVGLYIGDEIYSLTNIQEAVDYYGCSEDVAVSKLSKVDDSHINSAFKDVEMTSTPVGEEISSIILVNENQKMKKDGEELYDVWLTRAIIFNVGDREISFEKDIVPFSEEIIIQRGYDLENKISDNDDFLGEWDEEYTPSYERKKIVIK
ncbi:MAG: hypothetical protein VZR23_07445 [Lachnospiraceae bacterium]|nr:hypothetical protein [Lachnospiraceae bacterium]